MGVCSCVAISLTCSEKGKGQRTFLFSSTILHLHLPVLIDCLFSYLIFNIFLLPDFVLNMPISLTFWRNFPHFLIFCTFFAFRGSNLSPCWLHHCECMWVAGCRGQGSKHCSPLQSTCILNVDVGKLCATLNLF